MSVFPNPTYFRCGLSKRSGVRQLTFGLVGVSSDSNLMATTAQVANSVGIGIAVGKNSLGSRPTCTRSSPSTNANRIFFGLNSQGTSTLRYDSVAAIGGQFPYYHRSHPPLPLSVTVKAYSADQPTSPGFNLLFLKSFTYVSMCMFKPQNQQSEVERGCGLH